MKPIKRHRFLLILPFVFIGLTALSFKTNLFEVAKQLEIFSSVYKEIHMNYVDETNPAALMESAIKQMLKELDPYTVFLTEQDAEGFKIDQAGEYAGIGADLKLSGDKLIIQEVYEGFPADVSGLKAGDEIISIAGVDVKDLSGDALALLRGETGSTVSITYSRMGERTTEEVGRSAVEPKAVPFFGMADSNTGYIVLSRFNSEASQQVREAVLNLKDEGATQLILDLRGNPGGLLGEAVNIVNLFIPKGELVVSTQSSISSFNQVYTTREEALDPTIPLAILINGNSASASEIVAGSLQDLDRAVILGAQSFGKGLVQRQMPLIYGTQLKVTISRYFTPSGRCIQALDYQTRDADGNAQRKNEFTVFRTRNGREVTDSGGIAPDVFVPSEENSPILERIITDDLLFDFATSYCYTHPVTDIKAFTWSDADFKDFVTFADQRGFRYESEEEQLMKAILAKSPQTLGDSGVQSAYKNLLLSIDKNRQKQFESAAPKIKWELEKEIVKRLFYRAQLYQYLLVKDDAILTAKALLKDTSRYTALLK